MKETTTRVEAFSDAVIAIAITLLILEIKVPHAGGEEHLWTALAGLWPSYLAFLLSFFVIMVMWVNHHELIRMIEAVDYPFFFANGLVLLTVTFIPFPTAVLAEHLNTTEAGKAVAFYCATFIPNSLAWIALLYTIRRGDLFTPECTPEEISRIQRAYGGGLAGYLVAAVVAFYQPWLGLAINLALWILWVRLGYHSAADGKGVRSRRKVVGSRE